MKLIDITRELISAPVYPGDPAPALEPLSRMEQGDSYNLTAIHACLHNGTHLDAPLHFWAEGADITALPLDTVVGECSVIECSGPLVGAQLEGLLPFCKPRVLFKGEVSLTSSAVFVLAQAGVQLIGVESPSVATMEVARVHRELLSAGIWILEGLELSQVQPGTYMLLAAPLKIAGAEGAPVRALLMERQPSLDV